MSRRLPWCAAIALLGTVQAPAAGAEGATAGPSRSEALPSFLLPAGAAGRARDPLPVDQAFTPSVRATGPRTLAVRFAIHDCCYLYRERMRFRLSTTGGAPLGDGPRLAAVDLPAGERHTDPYFGTTEIYRGQVEFRLPLRNVPARARFVLDVRYQGCAETGAALCYEPVTRRFPVEAAGDALSVGAAIAARRTDPPAADRSSALPSGRASPSRRASRPSPRPSGRR